MTVRRETFSTWGKLISSQLVTDVKKWKEFAVRRGATLEKGAKSFSLDFAGMKVKYTKV